ncbi:hypothetical protein P6U35_30080, partial [Bacillus paranthracis]
HYLAGSWSRCQNEWHVPDSHAGEKGTPENRHGYLESDNTARLKTGQMLNSVDKSARPAPVPDHRYESVHPFGESAVGSAASPRENSARDSSGQIPALPDPSNGYQKSG